MRFKLLILIAAFLLYFFPAAQACAWTYTVTPGDSLYLISQRYGTSIEALMAWNGLNSTEIYPGQRLDIPESPVYVVRPGDTLYLIGRRFGIPYVAIMRANGITNSTIYPGQALLIPYGTQNQASRAGSRYTAEEFDLLARLITAEADDQDYIVKVAVGAVVLNRVRSPLFPNNITSVIYEPWQFEPVVNGWINRPASPEAVSAARDALNGWDPTNGALYFFESWVPNPFLQSLPVACVLGAFTFSYA